MKYALVFGALGVAGLYYAWTMDSLVLRGLALWGALAFGGVGAAYAGAGARIFGKRSDGRLPILSAWLFGPYHALNAVGLWLFRRQGREDAFNRIDDNIVLGCRLSPSDEANFKNLKIVAVLDVCGEFAEVGFIRPGNVRVLEYLSLPTLDTRAPSLEQLERGTRWMARQAARGPIYVHCALGHGRSATFVAAYLLIANPHRSVEDVLARVASHRPRIGLSREQLRRLREWRFHLHSSLPAHH